MLMFSNGKNGINLPSPRPAGSGTDHAPRFGIKVAADTRCAGAQKNVFLGVGGVLSSGAGTSLHSFFLWGPKNEILRRAEEERRPWKHPP